MNMDPETGVVNVGRLDGNAIAGPLSEIFRVDMTTASGECRHCRALSLIADARVELDDSGFIVRCPTCTRTLFTVVRTEERTWVDLEGIVGLSIPAPAG
jgi:4-hydroxy-3-methylbut-2-en-1-yl diphosphate synthase IspG/GcpE